jgi:glycopeptide antibiotics resistance protein
VRDGWQGHWQDCRWFRSPCSLLRPHRAASTAAPFCTVQFAAPSPGAVEALANVALFYPLVLFAAVATRRPALALLAGAALSLAIEALQGAVPGIGRACDTQDWLMNTCGATIAAGVAWCAIAISDRRAAQRRA